MVWRFDPSVVFLKACKKDSAGRNVWPLTIVCIYTIEPFGWQAVCTANSISLINIDVLLNVWLPCNVLARIWYTESDICFKKHTDILNWALTRTIHLHVNDRVSKNTQTPCYFSTNIELKIHIYSSEINTRSFEWFYWPLTSSRNNINW